MRIDGPDLRPSTDWQAVAVGLCCSALVLPLLLFLPRPFGNYGTVILGPAVAGAVAGMRSKNHGEEYVDGVVAGAGSLFVMAPGWLAYAFFFGASKSQLLVGATFLFGFALLIGLPFGVLVGGVSAAAAVEVLPERVVDRARR